MRQDRDLPLTGFVQCAWTPAESSYCDWLWSLRLLKSHTAPCWLSWRPNLCAFSFSVLSCLSASWHCSCGFPELWLLASPRPPNHSGGDTCKELVWCVSPGSHDWRRQPKVSAGYIFVALLARLLVLYASQWSGGRQILKVNN